MVFNIDRGLRLELQLVNKAIRSLMRIQPPLSERPAIKDTLEALGRHRRYLIRQRQPKLAARACR